MALIDFPFYHNLQDYKADNRQGMPSEDISWPQLKWAAISLGDFSYRHPSRQATRYYEGLLGFLLDEAPEGNHNFYVMSNDYSGAETSFKSSFSFFIGMVMAKVFAANKLKIPLLHLSDLAISATSNTKSKPDFFGFKGSQGFLIEAKGTSSSGTDVSKIEKAIRQLRAISSVSFTNSAHSFARSSLKGYAIRGCFARSAPPLTKNVLTCQIIDPNPRGDESIQIDSDIAFQSYYSTILSLPLIPTKRSDTNKSPCSCVDSIRERYQGFSFSRLGMDLVGIRDDIRKVLLPDNSNTCRPPKQTSESLIDIWNSNNEASHNEELDAFLGPDGIIVVANAYE